MTNVKRKFNSALTIILALMVSGCASIVSDSKYPVLINSNLAGVTVSIVNERGVVVHEGRTPMTVTLKSGTSYFNGADYQIIAKSVDGRETQTHLSSELDGWYVGNILFGGVIGLLIVDPLTGAMYKLPESMTVHFSEPLKKDELKVISKNTLTSEVQAELIPAGA